MTDIDKRNDPDVVVRIRHYVDERAALGVGSPWARDLLTEAADTIAELRAELAALRGEAEGAVSDLWRPGFDHQGVVTWALATDGHGDLVLRGPRGLRGWYLTTSEAFGLSDAARADLDAFGILRSQPSAGPLMRAAEAEARRLGLIGEVSDA